jgi:hypothetical protein
MSGQTPLEVGPEALETGPGVGHVRSIGQVQWELLESGQSSLEAGPWVRQVRYPSIEALLSSLSAEVRCLTRSVVWLCWRSVRGGAEAMMHEGGRPWWHQQPVTVAFGHICLVVVSTDNGLMVVWWSPPRSHLIVGGGALICRGECRWRIGVGGAAGRWLTMVDVGSGWSWNVKRRWRWWLFLGGAAPPVHLRRGWQSQAGPSASCLG